MDNIDNQFFTICEDIKAWLKAMRIENYTINEDLTVDVAGDVGLYVTGLKTPIANTIPLQFGVVNGDFNFYRRPFISLKGCPRKVLGDFDCSRVETLSSLEYSPQYVGGDFQCGYINLKSLKHAPKKVGGSFWCDSNQLTSLEYAPEEVGGSFICFGNKITSLKHLPKKIGRNLKVSGNELTSLEYAPKEVLGDFLCHSNLLTSLKGINIKVNGDFSCCSNKIEDFYNIDISIQDNIWLTPIEGMNYLNNYKDLQGNILVNFNEFKKLQTLKKLNDKLNDNLYFHSKNTATKHKI